MSKTVGIVAEYNPFHTGHKYQIDFLKEKGFENIVVAMSGSCVQRGEFALFDKFSRARSALDNSVDMVVEIPAPFVLRSAEGYAMAGMQTLKALGVGAVSFGSESADLHLLWEIAGYLLSDEYENNLKSQLAENIPFVQAREKAIFSKFDINREIVSASNDILAIEYLKACLKLGWKPEVVPVKRKGAGYNSIKTDKEFASASGIRNMIANYQQENAIKFIPAASKDIFEKNLDRGSFFIQDSSFEKALLFALRNKTSEYFKNIPDCNTELANNMEKAFSFADSIESLFQMLPTKRYTKSRLNRIILSALIEADNSIPRDIQYIRVLGFSAKGEEFLKQRSKNCPLPFSHSVKILGEKSLLCKKIADIESCACDGQAVFCKISGGPRKDFTSKIIKV